MSDSRWERLRSRMAESEADAFLVTNPTNVRYLSGFTAGEDARLLITRDNQYIITDFRYYEQAERQAPAYTLCKMTQSLPAAFAELAQQTGFRRVAFEAADVSYSLYQELAKAEGIELLPIKDWVQTLRAIKSPEELAAIRRAVAIGDAAFAALPSMLRPGITERELAWELEAFMRTHGAEDVSFPPIVAGGPNGAMPHAVPGEQVLLGREAHQRALVPGEPIVLDFGARVDGYCSDLTRTICVGQPGDRFREIHAIVLAAQQAAEAAIRPGMLGKEADKIARQVIVDAGYGEAFGHGLGHGVGLDVHELPNASPRGELALEPGMTVTVEPGVYLPGWGGVRIEDLVVVTETGIEVLTTASKDPAVSR
ncbi:MAG: M24 family metallopeptidase [Anaerolineae bacterium]